MKNTNIRKLAIAAVLTAIAVVGSAFVIPIGASKCSPVQHLVNILAGVYLGPWYSLGAAFCASLIRNILGTGTLLAFPGSMCGAFLCGAVYHLICKKGVIKKIRLPLAYCGELLGTSVIGGMLSFPIAAFLLGKEAALFTYVFPFFVSSCGGTIIAAVLVTAMKRVKVFDEFLGNAPSGAEKV